ncbi:MAG: hypothetical protein ACYC22_06335 [Thiomonas delicata]
MSKVMHLSRIRHVLALLGGDTSRWEVEAVDANNVVRRWVVGDQPTNVFALGAELTAPARALEHLDAATLAEVMTTSSMLESTLEQLQSLDWLLERTRRRAYRLHYKQQYADLKWMADCVHRCLTLLKREHERFLEEGGYAAWANLEAPALEPDELDTTPASPSSV